MTERLKIGITTGDPAGIGPEIVLKAIDRIKGKDNWLPVVFGDLAVLNQAKELIVMSGLENIKNKLIIELIRMKYYMCLPELSEVLLHSE